MINFEFAEKLFGDQKVVTLVTAVAYDLGLTNDRPRNPKEMQGLVNLLTQRLTAKDTADYLTVAQGCGYL